MPRPGDFQSWSSKSSAVRMETVGFQLSKETNIKVDNRGKKKTTICRHVVPVVRHRAIEVRVKLHVL